MQFSPAIVAVFAASAIASPIVRRDNVVVTEEVYVYPDGEVVSTAYATSTVAATQTTPAPIAAVQQAAADPTTAAPTTTDTTTLPSPVQSGGAFVQQASANTQSSSLASQLIDLSAGVRSYISKFANQDVATTTGFVDPQSALFSQMSLYHTNVHRANSSLNALTWDDDLATKAQAWADACVMDEGYNSPGNVGSNAAWSSSSSFNPSDFISSSWYNGELAKYPWGADPASLSGSSAGFETWGHISQLLWSDTTSMGCAIQNNCNGAYKSHALCYYSPPGNYAGEFSKVGSPNGGPTVNANAS